MKITAIVRKAITLCNICLLDVRRAGKPTRYIHDGDEINLCGICHKDLQHEADLIVKGADRTKVFGVLARAQRVEDTDRIARAVRTAETMDPMARATVEDRATDTAAEEPLVSLVETSPVEEAPTRG